MISYWSNLTTGKTDKISYKLYSVMLRNTLNKTGEYKWLNKIKTILDETGFTSRRSNIWRECSAKHFSLRLLLNDSPGVSDSVRRMELREDNSIQLNAFSNV